MKRISNEEILDTWFNIFDNGGTVEEADRAIAQAQLDSCREEVREMIGEIEKQAILAPEGDIIEISLDNEWWQDFKERWLND